MQPLSALLPLLICVLITSALSQTPLESSHLPAPPRLLNLAPEYFRHPYVTAEPPHLFKTATILRTTNLRPDPSTKNPAISKLKLYETVFLGGQCENDFCRIRTANGLIGWVSRRNMAEHYFTPIEANSEADVPLYFYSDKMSALGFTNEPHRIEFFTRPDSYQMTLASLRPRNPTFEQEKHSEAAIAQLTPLTQKWNRAEAEAIQKAVAELPLGQVIFNHFDDMKALEEHTIKIVISRDLNDELQKNFKAEGVIEREEVKIATKMRVRLIAPTFEIETVGDEEQAPTPDGNWAFNVKPLKAGTQKMQFLISAKILSSFGAEMNKDYPVLEKTVVVHIAPLNEAAHFVAAHWNWLLTAVILPPLGWLLKEKYAAFTKKRPKKKKPKKKKLANSKATGSVK